MYSMYGWMPDAVHESESESAVFYSKDINELICWCNHTQK